MSRVVLVCGGRTYQDRTRMTQELDKLQPTKIVHGGASGADALAAVYARARGIPVAVYPADWRTHGRSAAPRRNAVMLERESPHTVIAFPGGTADLVRRAKSAGIETIEVAA